MFLSGFKGNSTLEKGDVLGCFDVGDEDWTFGVHALEDALDVLHSIDKI